MNLTFLADFRVFNGNSFNSILVLKIDETNNKLAEVVEK